MFHGASYSGKTLSTALANSPLSGDLRYKRLNVSEEDQSTATRIVSKETPARAAADAEALLVECPVKWQAIPASCIVFLGHLDIV